MIPLFASKVMFFGGILEWNKVVRVENQMRPVPLGTPDELISRTIAAVQSFEA